MAEGKGLSQPYFPGQYNNVTQNIKTRPRDCVQMHFSVCLQTLKNRIVSKFSLFNCHHCFIAWKSNTIIIKNNVSKTEKEFCSYYTQLLFHKLKYAK